MDIQVLRNRIRAKQARLKKLNPAYDPSWLRVLPDSKLKIIEECKNLDRLIQREEDKLDAKAWPPNCQCHFHSTSKKKKKRQKRKHVRRKRWDTHRAKTRRVKPKHPEPKGACFRASDDSRHDFNIFCTKGFAQPDEDKVKSSLHQPETSCLSIAAAWIQRRRVQSVKQQGSSGTLARIHCSSGAVARNQPRTAPSVVESIRRTATSVRRR